MKFVFVLLLFTLAAALFAANFYVGVFDDLFFQRGEQETFQDVLKKKIVAELSLQEPEEEIFSPEPLRVFPEEAASSGLLSEAGVFTWTNTHRQTAGLALLERSQALDAIAAKKVQDMFARQYFAHVSPSNEGIGELARKAGYEFIVIGENLALGNFENDEALVQAWMDSPGHRANILGARHEEIGIAVEQGVFEGNSTLLAVQVFALPLSACDSPDQELKQETELGTMQIDELALILEQMRAELNEYRPKAGPGYNRKVEEHNALVDQYNSLVVQVQADTKAYNIQVRAFNACAQQ